MATSVKTVADRVFNLLKGYGFQIDTYNKEGEVVGDPAEAIRFFVEDPKDIRPALEKAFASNKVCCINVMTDPTTVSPASEMLANVGAYKA